MASKTIVSCDLCGSEGAVKTSNVPVLFLTEQTEGRYLDNPSIYIETLDLCASCKDRLIKNMPLTATGAQGYNRSEWKKDDTIMKAREGLG